MLSSSSAVRADAATEPSFESRSGPVRFQVSKEARRSREFFLVDATKGSSKLNKANT